MSKYKKIIFLSFIVASLVSCGNKVDDTIFEDINYNDFEILSYKESSREESETQTFANIFSKSDMEKIDLKSYDKFIDESIRSANGIKNTKSKENCFSPFVTGLYTIKMGLATSKGDDIFKKYGLENRTKALSFHNYIMDLFNSYIVSDNAYIKLESNYTFCPDHQKINYGELDKLFEETNLDINFSSCNDIEKNSKNKYPNDPKLAKEEADNNLLIHNSFLSNNCETILNIKDSYRIEHSVEEFNFKNGKTDYFIYFPYTYSFVNTYEDLHFKSISLSIFKHFNITYLMPLDGYKKDDIDISKLTPEHYYRKDNSIPISIAIPIMKYSGSCLLETAGLLGTNKFLDKVVSEGINEKGYSGFTTEFEINEFGLSGTTYQSTGGRKTGTDNNVEQNIIIDDDHICIISLQKMPLFIGEFSLNDHHFN